MHQVGNRPVLFVYARYDLSFPLHLSKDIIEESRRWKVPTTVRVLPCGHYTTGKSPFKFIDGYYMASFLRRHL
jgi:pimeloyl-ACP methyl ester carboxylesterase